MLQQSLRPTGTLASRCSGAKENNFARRWGKTNAGESSNVINSAFGNRTSGNQPNNVAAQLPSSVRVEARLHAVREESKFNHAIATVVQWFYDRLEAASAEYNYAMGWSGLNVKSTRPELVNEVTRTNNVGDVVESVTHFRTRFSTGTMSLVICGSNRKVDFYLSTTENISWLSQSRGNTQPIVTLMAMTKGGNVQWEVDGEPLYQSGMEVISMWLFEQFVEKSREQSLATEVA